VEVLIMSNSISPNLDELIKPFGTYAAYVRSLLDGRCDAAVVEQVVVVVAGLEEALSRQARDEIEIDLRLSAFEERMVAVLKRLGEISES